MIFYINKMEKLLEQVITKLKFLEKRFEVLEKRVANLEKRPTKKLKIKKKSPNKSPKKSSDKTKKKITIKEGVIKITKYNNGLVLTGDTYDKRGIIKKHKGWWTPKKKGWTVKLEYYSQLATELKKCTSILSENEVAETLDYIDASYNPKNLDKKQTIVNKVHNSGCDDLDFLSDSD